MHLTKEDEKILNGECGEGAQLAMQILYNLGEFYEASRMIEISSAQVSGVSYKTCGESLIDVLEQFAKGGARTCVPAYLNPAGMDLSRWKEMGITSEFAKPQLRIIDIYKSLGVLPTSSCTPYLMGNIPRRREHLAWSESSAVVFANTFFGARTNRESGISALASAIIGKTPLYGLHLIENRVPEVLFKISFTPEEVDYTLLGYYIGKKCGAKVPYIKGLSVVGRDQIKSLGAAIGAAGAVGLIHVENITPECGLYRREAITDIIKINASVMHDLRAEYAPPEVPDVVVLGCPHASVEELKFIAERLKGKKISRKLKLWVFTAGAVKCIAERMGWVQTIENAGGEVFCDTCMVVSPIISAEYDLVLTDSAKAAHYIPTLCGVPSGVLGTEDCINLALTGKLPD